MQSIKFLPASNQAANPSLATVQTLRSAGASDIIVNTVAGFPNFFHATMGTPHTFTDPVTSEVITVISEASAVDFAGHLNSGKITIDVIAPGYTDIGSKVGDIIIVRPITAWADNIYNLLNAGALNDNGTLAPTALDAFYKPVEITPNSFVFSGGVIAQTTLLTASFSDIVYYLTGVRYTKTGVANRIYTISKDTYVDIDNTGTLFYTEVANGATTGFPLTAGRMRLAKVVTNATTITSVTQYGVDALAVALRPNGANSFNNIDVNGLFLNVKSATNPGTISPANGDNDFGANCRVSFTVAAPCIALVIVNVGVGSAGDSEHRPTIYLDGVNVHAFTPSAATIASASRPVVRSTIWPIQIPTAGAHTLSAGVFVSGGASYSVAGGGAEITALILGKVTA